MDTIPDVEWLFFGISPDQWTQINGLASSITAAAAVVGVILAARAVHHSNRGVKAGLESVAIDRRVFLNDQFSSMVSDVYSFGEKVDLFALALPADATSDPQDAEALRAELPGLYAAMNTAKQRVRGFRALGLGDLDGARRKSNGELTLDTALYALEAILDERYMAADWDSAVPEERSQRLPDFPIGTTGREVLDETVAFFMDHLGPIDRTPDVREALLDALQWMWVWDLDKPWRVQRSEFVRHVFDMVVDLTQECFAISAHSAGKWASDVPAPRRGWTCRCGTQNADHSSGLCRPKDKRTSSSRS